MPRLEDLPVVRAPAISAAQMAEIDAAAGATFHLAAEVLMENASRGVARAARAFLDGAVAGRRIVALAGPGNNGGDALAASRYLANWGARVEAKLAVAPDRLRALPRAQLEAARAAGVDVSGEIADATLREADLMLDGLLGYSASGAPRGAIAALIAAANASRAPILAVDLPSGLHPDTGTPLDGCIVATLTVTLGLPKSGLLRDGARRFVGRLLLADIGVPPIAYERFGLDTRALFAKSDLVVVGN